MITISEMNCDLFDMKRFDIWISNNGRRYIIHFDYERMSWGGGSGDSLDSEAKTGQPEKSPQYGLHQYKAKTVAWQYNYCHYRAVKKKNKKQKQKEKKQKQKQKGNQIVFVILVFVVVVYFYSNFDFDDLQTPVLLFLWIFSFFFLCCCSVLWEWLCCCSCCCFCCIN